ncbi:MAG: DUF5818 domain-containing protein, partial [Candidatus Competibacteraceae bacterium]|nr:DUF5818 domain-containing protein [Candidatus Competibacteraceae bacterium]
VSPPTLAQSPCGDQVTVVAGDTLSRIANRCNIALEALLAANPWIDNPDRIDIGMTLAVPGGEPSPAPRTVRDVDISPESGPAGSTVTLTASGFPPSTPVEIGVGRHRSEYRIIEGMTTDARGRLETQARLPDHAERGERWVFVVLPVGQGRETVSEVFTVGSNRPGRSVGELMGIKEVRGVLTDEGVECQALRGDDGRLYTLGGDLEGFGVGDRVRVTGQVAQASFCMQGTTLGVRTIEKLQRD